MLAIKLRPVGKKKQISYRVVVAKKRSKLKGESIEDFGWYNPHTKKFSLDTQRIQYWIGVGAQPTDSIHNILVRAKVLKEAKIAKHRVVPAKEQPVEAVAQKTESTAPVVDAKPVEEVASQPEVVNSEVAEQSALPEEPAVVADDSSATVENASGEQTQEKQEEVAE